MAGHSKWANIKFRKEKQDAKKGKVFTRIAKEIITAVKLSGADPQGNPRLRLALQKARAENMPKESVERNIKNALNSDQKSYDEITYELYGHGGVGLIAEIMTDNKNRIASDIRIATNKRGGTVAMPGAVVYNFDRKGIIQVERSKAVEDSLFHLALEAGSEDFEVGDDYYVITTDPKDLFPVREKLEAAGITVAHAEFDMIPKTYVNCDGETRKANEALIEWLEGIDDIDVVYHNMEEPDVSE